MPPTQGAKSLSGVDRWCMDLVHLYAWHYNLTMSNPAPFQWSSRDGDKRKPIHPSLRRVHRLGQARRKLGAVNVYNITHRLTSHFYVLLLHSRRLPCPFARYTTLVDRSTSLTPRTPIRIGA